MRKFSDFGIKPKTDRFTGDKIRIMKVINQPVIVHNYKVNESKFRDSGSGKCLSLQIEFKGEKRVLFTGSRILAEMIQQVPKEELPFETTITKEGEAYQLN